MLNLLFLLAALFGLFLWKRKMDIVTISIGAVATFGGIWTFAFRIVVENYAEFTQLQTVSISGAFALIMTIIVIAIAEQF